MAMLTRGGLCPPYPDEQASAGAPDDRAGRRTTWSARPSLAGRSSSSPGWASRSVLLAALRGLHLRPPPRRRQSKHESRNGPDRLERPPPWTTAATVPQPGSTTHGNVSRSKLATFLRETLQLELSPDKTLVTHARTGAARFLGYEITTQHNSMTARAVNGQIGATCSPDAIKAKIAPT